jgi:GTP diphosphokinase / guanosine-3',5'-bis(diphosphate) 3'-diphosphatase
MSDIASDFARDSALLLAAAHFAADRHRDQRRKDIAASPYINHPIAVAEVMACNGVTDIVALQAALLHDTIEDTETTVVEIEDGFGADVLSVVLEVTDDKSLEKAERKRRQIERAPGMSDAAKLVKLGDKICNATDVATNPPAGWDQARRVEYLDWTEAVVRGCRGVHTDLEAHYDRTLADARAVIAGTDGL